MSFRDIATATRAARERSGNSRIGTRVKAGQIQIVDVDYNKRGVSTVVPLSDWMPLSEIVNALERIA